MSRLVRYLKQIRYENSLCIASYFSLVGIAALYIFPWIIAIISSTVLMYVNAWDEETYLTYQSGYGLLQIFGYKLDGLIIIALQGIGLSGAQINLYFDLIVTPLTFIIIGIGLSRFGMDLRLSLLLSSIIIFCPILFNAGNPISGKLSTITNDLIYFGKEGYQSALRTPEPQLSLLILSIFFFLYAEYQRIWLLFVPSFLAYPHLSVAYTFAITLYYIHSRHISSRAPLFGGVAAGSVLLVFVGILFIVIDVLGLLIPLKEANPHHFIPTHNVHIPGITLFITPLLFIQIITTRNISLNYRNLGFLVYISILCVANIQLISGYSISYKNYYDYGLNFLGGAYLAILAIQAYKSNNRALAEMICLISMSAILALNNMACGPDFKNKTYKVWLSEQSLSAEAMAKAAESPFQYYIIPKNSRGKLAYSYNKAIAPIFSYQYGFSFIGDSCPEIYNRMRLIHEKNIGNYRRESGKSIDNDWDESIMKTMSGNRNKKRLNRLNDARCLDQDLNHPVTYLGLESEPNAFFIFKW